MKAKYTCPKCISSDILHNVRVLAGTDSGYVAADLAVFRNPDALVFKGAQRTPLTARVCGQCGFVEFYAQDPGALRVANT